MTRKIFCSGQSNMEGVASDGYFPTTAHLQAWNNTKNLDTLTYLGTQWLTPNISNQPFAGDNNFGLNGAYRLYKETDVNVDVVIVAKGSQPVANWYSSYEPQAMLDRSLAVLDAAGVTALDGFWWHQGEADNATDPDDYWVRFRAVLNTLRGAGLISWTTPIVMGETIYSGSNSCLNKCVELAPAYGYTKLRLIPIKRFEVITDSGHFTGSEYPRIGSLYAAYQLMLEG